MRYLLLIYGTRWAELPVGEEQAVEARRGTLPPGSKRLVSRRDAPAGHDRDDSAVREGQTLTTDGPFAETKEQLGGYYMVECENLDQAIEAASRIPAAPYGSIEIRPVTEYPEGM
jgi:hypothetical protein